MGGQGGLSHSWVALYVTDSRFYVTWGLREGQVNLSVVGYSSSWS